MSLSIKFTNSDGKIPFRNEGDACFDLFSKEDVVLCPVGTGRHVQKISTGLRFAIPEGWYGQILTRSSLALRGINVVGGVIDSSYRGEICVILSNTCNHEFPISRGSKIAQIAFLPVPRIAMEQVETLDSTARGENGFGSTGN